MKTFNVQVNPYLEFMNSILLTSRYNEMTTPYIGYGLMNWWTDVLMNWCTDVLMNWWIDELMNDDKNEYTDAVKAFFEPYRQDIYI